MRVVALVAVLSFLALVPANAGELSLIVSGVWLEKTGENEPPRTTNQFVDVDFDAGSGGAVGLLWKFSEHWALETKASWILMDSTAWIIRPDAIVALKLGDLDVVPLTAVVQWRPEMSGNWNPYLGAGGAHIFFGTLPLEGGGKIEIDDDTAFVMNAGLDIQFSERWFVNGDLKYMPFETGSFGQSPLGESSEIRFEPIIGSAGIRYRF